jgi:hypothetical protein
MIRLPRILSVETDNGTRMRPFAGKARQLSKYKHLNYQPVVAAGLRGQFEMFLNQAGLRR